MPDSGDTASGDHQTASEKALASSADKSSAKPSNGSLGIGAAVKAGADAMMKAAGRSIKPSNKNGPLAGLGAAARNNARYMRAGVPSANKDPNTKKKSSPDRNEYKMAAGKGGYSSSLMNTREDAALKGKSGLPGNPVKFGIKTQANMLGIRPIDLARIVNYETAGTFSTSKTLNWRDKKGRQRKQTGVIQFSDGPGGSAQKYGVVAGEPFDMQMRKAGQYLKDTGVKPGMNINQVYAAVLSGSPKRTSASDINGPVSKHVEIMTDPQHTARAVSFYEGRSVPKSEAMQIANDQAKPKSSQSLPERIFGGIGDGIKGIGKKAETAKPSDIVGSFGVGGQIIGGAMKMFGADRLIAGGLTGMGDAIDDAAKNGPTPSEKSGDAGQKQNPAPSNRNSSASKDVAKSGLMQNASFIDDATKFLYGLTPLGQAEDLANTVTDPMAALSHMKEILIVATVGIVGLAFVVMGATRVVGSK